MTHDPLCWFPDPAKTPAVAVNDDWPCVCDLIARVREDEQGRQYEAQSENWVKGYAAALRDAREAVKALDLSAVLQEGQSAWARSATVAAIDALANSQTADAEPDKSPGGAS